MLVNLVKRTGCYTACFKDPSNVLCTVLFTWQQKRLAQRARLSQRESHAFIWFYR